MGVPIRLTVDVRALYPERIGGLEIAFREVFDRLRRRGDAVRITLLTAAQNHSSFDAWEGDVERRLYPPGAPVDPEALERDADLLYAPFLFVEPDPPPVPAVVLIPDLQHLRFPEFFSPEVLALRLRRFRTGATRSRRVLTLSEHSRDAITRAFHLPRRRVAAVALDAADRFRRPRDGQRIAELRRKLGLPERWLFYPANDWPHKNHARLFRALARLGAETGERPMLLLAGARVSGLDLEEAARAAGVGDRVRHLGWLDADDLPTLYDGAVGVPFVSLHEGFGLPAVEAMRRGAPLVVAAGTSLEEVAGEAALTVDPEDEVAIAEAIGRVLAGREDVEARVRIGRDRAARFSFDRAAEATLAVFREALAEPATELSRATVEEPPRVFVVTPSYQQAPYLGAAIDSVLAQRYPRLDYFVADGGSIDGSVEILRSYGDRLRWRSEPDGGQAAAIAAAWRSCDADVVAWLNSDDVWQPGAVERAVDHLLAHPGAALVYGRSRLIDEAGRTIGEYATRPWDAAAFRQECFVSQPATFVRRDVLLRSGFPDPDLRFAMDYDLWIRIARDFELSYLDAELAGSRVHPATKSLREREAVFEEILRVTTGHFGVAPRNWAIGSILHRCEVWRTTTLRRLPERLAARLVAGRARRLERRLTATLHSDGWSGTRSRVEVRARASGPPRLECESPFWPYRRPLAVRVEWNGRTVARHACRERGRFGIELRLPAAAFAQGDGSEVEVIANRTFVPSVVGWTSADPRPISFRVLDS